MSYGTDFGVMTDFDSQWSFNEYPRSVLIQALARRYMTPRGGNPWDPAYGRDLRLYVGSAISPAVAEIEVADEARKDERVKDAKAKIAVVGDTWNITIGVTPSNGVSFTFTISVSRLTVTLLQQQGK